MPQTSGMVYRMKTSSGKTNFWTYAQILYGAALAVDQGLAGASMPGDANTPQAFTWDASDGCFTAEGIPIVPKDDAGKKNFYPMMSCSARGFTSNRWQPSPTGRTGCSKS